MIPLPKKKYQIIYADPPWRYEHPISNSRKIENQYSTMELEEKMPFIVHNEPTNELVKACRNMIRRGLVGNEVDTETEADDIIFDLEREIVVKTIKELKKLEGLRKWNTR